MTNRLADALSPYLRSHAENPVDWHPWGAEAFEEAQRRGVPLLISIGYSTCHWCHVMARESFSDPEIAASINRDFVAVKVDREEHPDVDGSYLASASAFTQNLGWPLTVFATPTGRTFFAGTYWPPQARAPLPAFRDVLAAVQDAWTRRREQATESADAVVEALAATSTTMTTDLPASVQLITAAAQIAAREDRTHGGFGGAPKFPVATTLRFLQTPLVRRDAPESAAVADRALAAMAASALHDEDGGFFRYATQRDWTQPHYERMLTDNAQLMDAALRAGDEDTVRGAAAFLLATLRRADGGFGSAQDSESWIDGRRDEGGYYRRALAERDAFEPPAVDGKVITGWNGLAIGALARAGQALDTDAWTEAAIDAATAVLAANRDTAGRLVRMSVQGVASSAVATTADLALLADGLLALATATGEASWAVTGMELLDEALDGAEAADPVLAAQGIPTAPDQTDGDLPSGASALAGAALTAWRLGAGERYRRAAEDLVQQHAAAAVEHPFGHGALLGVAAGLIDAPRQLVVVTADRRGPLAQTARTLDADVIAIVTAAEAAAFAAAGFALFEGKGGFAGKAGFEGKDGENGIEGDGSPASDRAYDCRGFVCRLPTSDPADLQRER